MRCARRRCTTRSGWCSSSTHNSARSQLAAALWTDTSTVPATSAGTHPAAAVHPGAVAAAQRHRVPLTPVPPRHVDDVPSAPRRPRRRRPEGRPHNGGRAPAGVPHPHRALVRPGAHPHPHPPRTCVSPAGAGTATTPPTPASAPRSTPTPTTTPVRSSGRPTPAQLWARFTIALRRALGIALGVPVSGLLGPRQVVLRQSRRVPAARARPLPRRHPPRRTRRTHRPTTGRAPPSTRSATPSPARLAPP